MMSIGVLLRKLAQETSVLAIDRLINDPDTPIQFLRPKTSRKPRLVKNPASGTGKKSTSTNTRI